MVKVCEICCNHFSCSQSSTNENEIHATADLPIHLKENQDLKTHCNIFVSADGEFIKDAVFEPIVYRCGALYLSMSALHMSVMAWATRS